MYLYDDNGFKKRIGKIQTTIDGRSWIKPVAQTGYIAKGIVYFILGLLAFMAAFEISGQSDDDATTTGVFDFIKDLPAGVLLLVLLAIGLICYSMWRGVQAFAKNSARSEKWTKKVRYAFSGIGYLSLAVTAIKIALSSGSKNNGDKNQDFAASLLSESYGQWIAGIIALLIAANGFYQIYYGLSEKYKKHVQELSSHSTGNALLLRSGKIGYTARGLVWLLVAYLLFKAALHANSSEAGNTGKAFRFVEASAFGSYLLGAIGLGLIAYGVFNFIRAKYERFE